MGNCGPKNKTHFKWCVKLGIALGNYLLDRLTPHFFQASCLKHDLGYLKGGNEKRRFECDSKFFYFMCRDIEGMRGFFFKSKLYFLAFIYYYAVRFFGKYYFNYHTMIYCIAQFTATEGNKELLKEKLIKLSQMNKETGCEFYIPTEQVPHEIANGNSGYDFTFIEKFKSLEAFNSHTKEDYVSKFFEENAHLVFRSNIFITSPLLGKD